MINVIVSKYAAKNQHQTFCFFLMAQKLSAVGFFAPVFLGSFGKCEVAMIETL
jgi:hypothetical protein